ncbi:MAG: hypothetical protein K2N80_08820 [Lachnospiraceae bacterium]|nr:hypothetical protein [Lachnospiraceae bacterium]
MDECLGYLIGIGVVVWIVYLIIVYIIIPCLVAALAICFVLGAAIGLCNTAYNYVQAINEVVGGK